MIVVKIERWPDNVDPDSADAARVHRTDIAKAVIRNDHTGTKECGNYAARLYDPPAYNPWAGVTLETRVEAFPRRELGAWDLVYRVLTGLLAERNETGDALGPCADGARAIVGEDGEGDSEASSA